MLNKLYAYAVIKIIHGILSIKLRLDLSWASYHARTTKGTDEIIYTVLGQDFGTCI